MFEPTRVIVPSLASISARESAPVERISGTSSVPFAFAGTSRLDAASITVTDFTTSVILRLFRFSAPDTCNPLKT